MADLKTQFGFTDSLFNAINEVKNASGTSVSGADAQIERAKANLDAAELRARHEKENEKVQKKKESLRSESFEQVDEADKKPSTVNMSHQGKTTLKHIKNPTVQQRMLAHDIKPGIKGYRDRVAVLRTAKEHGNLKEDELEELDEISTKTLAKAAKSSSDPDSDYSYGKSHDPQKFADHAKKTKDAKSAAAVQGAADAKGHYPRDNHTQGYDKLAHRTPSRVTASGKANKQDTKALKTKLKEEELEESFSPAQIATLKAEYSKINGIDPSQPTYKKLIAMLDKLDLASLKSLAGADIKFVSGLAKNRVTRKSVKEDVELDESHSDSKDPKMAALHKRAQDVSKQHGVVQHINKNDNDNGHHVSDFYDDEKTVATYNKGKLREGFGLDEALRGDGSTHEGEFQEKGHGNWFTYKKTADAWAKKHGLQHEIEVGDHGGVGGLKSTRFGTVKGTVAHIATGENDNGTPSMEKWALKKHNKYDKWGARAESVDMSEDEKEIEEGTGSLKPGWMLKKDPELAKKVKEKQDLAKKRQSSYGDKSAGKSVAESIMDKIKAVKRGMEAKAKAADHFDKASEPSNPNKSKDLKRAVKYHNLVNKEETEVEEELSPAQKAIDKNKNDKIDGTDLAHLRSKKKQPQGADFAAARRKERLASNGRMDEEVKVGDKVSFDHPMKAIPGKTMKKVGTVHKVEDDTVHIKVKDKYGVITHKKSASELTKEEFEYIDEAPKYDNKYTIYHKDYSSAVQHAAVHAGKQGYEIDHDDWDRVVAMGPKKPSAGKTNILNVSLKKNGVETKKKLHMQVYNMDNKGYELNTYVEEVGGYDEFKSGGKPLEKKFNKAFKAMGIKSDVKIKTVGNVSVNEAAKQPTKRFKDMKKSKLAGTKSEEGDSKKGEPLSGKKEPIEVNPEMHKNQK